MRAPASHRHPNLPPLLRPAHRVAAAGLGLLSVGIAVAGTGAALIRGLPPTVRVATARPAAARAPAVSTAVDGFVGGVQTAAEPAGFTTVRTGPAATAGRSAPAAPPVAPLRVLVSPDLFVQLPTAVTPALLGRLRHIPRLTLLAVVDTGRVHTPAGWVEALGVDPSQFRGFTPRLSAQSDPLWQSVARGEMTFSFSYAGRLRQLLGRTFPVTGRDTVPLRLGAFASIGLLNTGLLVDHVSAARLGLAPSHGLVLAAPQLPLPVLQADLAAATGRGAVVNVLRPVPVNQAMISPAAQSTIPPAYLRLYREAATTCPGLPWTVLAGIGEVESRQGVDAGVSSAGAMGPMQFLPSTFAVYGVDVHGTGVPNINDPADAIFSAARYLCSEGAGRGGQSLYDAIYAYNHADWYVRLVLSYALSYQ